MALAPGLRGDASDALLWVRELRKRYGGGRGLTGRARASVQALDGVSLDVRRGEVVGVVGESGSGKSTLARCILRLTRQDDGDIVFGGVDPRHDQGRGTPAATQTAQCAFQDPFSSLDPRYNVGDLISEPLIIHGVGSGERTAAVAKYSTLSASAAPLSGGSRTNSPAAAENRFGAFARVEAGVAILDEPVSALDVSVQAQILDLLADLRDD